MLWVDRVLAGASAVQSLSWSLACPFHCGSNLLLVGAFGFLLGLLFGFVLAVALWFLVKPSLDFAHHQPGSGPVFPALRRRQPRLEGYLYE